MKFCELKIESIFKIDNGPCLRKVKPFQNWNAVSMEDACWWEIDEQRDVVLISEQFYYKDLFND